MSGGFSYIHQYLVKSGKSSQRIVEQDRSWTPLQCGATMYDKPVSLKLPIVRCCYGVYVISGNTAAWWWRAKWRQRWRPAWPWAIRDSWLCCICFYGVVGAEVQPCAFWMAATLDHLEAHRFLQWSKYKGLPKIPWTKYKVVTATKMVGEHSHPNIRGWEGSLTQETGKTLVKRGNRFNMTSIVRGHAPGQQESPLCPVHSIGRGGWVLLELAIFTEASGEKREVSAVFFLPNLENLAVGKVQHTGYYLQPTWTMR